MKLIIVQILSIFSIIALMICPIWAVVQFIVYLVKDIPFNWWSVWSIVISGAATLFFIGYTAFLQEMEKIKRNEETGTEEKPIRKSKFQQRLDEIREQREKLKKK